MGKHDARITETASRFADLCADLLLKNITVGGVILKDVCPTLLWEPFHCLISAHSYYIQ